MAIDITYTSEGDLLITCGSESRIWPLAAHMSMAKLIGCAFRDVAVEIQMKQSDAQAAPSPASSPAGAPAPASAITPALSPAPVKGANPVSGWQKPWPRATAFVSQLPSDPSGPPTTIVQLEFGEMADAADLSKPGNQALADLIDQSNLNVERLAEEIVATLHRGPRPLGRLSLALPLDPLKFQQVVRAIDASVQDKGTRVLDKLQFVFPQAGGPFTPD
ncbi:hypothetical protein LXT12_00665 [Pelomonas sp. P7]|uniref:Uncharacterized protein n=1 Tax=Pelomonas caseinilytica TaxID=2906763 RepID=A0ABS8X5Z3_9BURK|nr:hypothetical protein [Pelomonas sp. P7]MCE4535772.1 hypothetical protein [Pelomonas sp. P7]